MKQMWLFLLVLFFYTKAGLEKTEYQFSKEPIDVVIVAHEKDIATLPLVIEGVRKHIKYHKIFIVSEKPLIETDKATWFDEANFPFTKEAIAQEIFKDQTKAQAFLQHPKTRIGWIFQQLCKLYALFVIPDISDNVLILDADTIFLRPVRFQKKDGRPKFTAATEYHLPYFAYMARLIPGLSKVHKDKSGVAHHMLFQKPIMADLFETISTIHHEEPWKAMCHCIDTKEIYGSCMSEYELYFNFACTRTDQLHIRQLRWSNTPLRTFLVSDHKQSKMHYISCHNYL